MHSLSELRMLCMWFQSLLPDPSFLIMACKFNYKYVLQVIAQTIKKCLDSLPGFPRTQIGFITYDSTIHFYNMKASDLCIKLFYDMLSISLMFHSLIN